MKKVLILVAVLAMTGIASAELLNNPETFETLALGQLANQDNWEQWGSGSGSAGWNGGFGINNVVDTGSNQAAYVAPDPAQNWWSYQLIFNHGNDLAALSGSGTNLQLDVDVLAGGQNGIVKIEFYDDLARTTNILTYAWDPRDISAVGTHTFVVDIPAGANYVTPVLGTTGVGTSITVDNLALTLVPEPATMALLGLGGLFLSRRKK